MKSKYFTLSSLFLILVSFIAVVFDQIKPLVLPSHSVFFVFGIFPLISLFLSLISYKKSFKKGLNMFLIIASILMLLIFYLMATSHCGFYTGKCR